MVRLFYTADGKDRFNNKIILLRTTTGLLQKCFQR